MVESGGNRLEREPRGEVARSHLARGGEWVLREENLPIECKNLGLNG